MARRLLAVALLVSVMFVVGCAVIPNGSVLAPIALTKSPVAVGDLSVGTDNVGEAKCEGILFVAVGDASIETAMRNGRLGPITRVHHVDSEELNILGIYCRQIVRVYGE